MDDPKEARCHAPNSTKFGPNRSFTMADSPRDLDVTQAAKLLRAKLAAAFPATKFSVRTSRFSMGESIEVGWTDGPSEKRVKEIIDAFKDISRDSAGEILAGGNRYLGLDRSFSSSATAWAAKQTENADGDYGNEKQRLLSRTSFDANGRPHIATR
jgi:hypothetical protein